MRKTLSVVEYDQSFGVEDHIFVRFVSRASCSALCAPFLGLACSRQAAAAIHGSYLSSYLTPLFLPQGQTD